ncbi:exonuclease SbcCD subunit D [Bacillaceae bacterium SIJ1]|uniref:exonuclease SbcCD subunit D n=1 Tax=Litoribacterium kuwaitense TaxID=1398745 RepID=UPI0013EC71EC|nr:exonuclease SbcCD subunit D [Litoribacterium kuwaitense]NGP44511.1 exonuclease SbcCD subunit D [Litoribacterium kuwaitense]
MRILHTADWHLGKSLEGRDRMLEQEAFLQEILEIADDQQVDAILMAGDVFDTVNPSAAAETLFYNYALKMASPKRPLFVIAGNHDHPERLIAAKSIAESQGIYIWGPPVPTMASMPLGEKQELLQLAVLPYPSESRLASYLSKEIDEHALQQAYNEKVGALFRSLNASYQTDAVKIATSHLFAIGGRAEGVERPIEVGGAYTVETNQFPQQAQYVALGHLHRPQTLKGNPLARYSGSPLAYSFKESQHAKSVTIIEASPNEPVSVEEIFLRSGRPLVRWEATEGISQVFRWIDEGKDAKAWLDVRIHVHDVLDGHTIHALRKAHPGIIHIHPVFPEQAKSSFETARTSLPIDELFKQFYRQQTGGAEVDEAVLSLFMALVQRNDAEEGKEDIYEASTTDH